jgi:hypothetical protein
VFSPVLPVPDEQTISYIGQLYLPGFVLGLDIGPFAVQQANGC